MGFFKRKPKDVNFEADQIMANKKLTLEQKLNKIVDLYTFYFHVEDEDANTKLPKFTQEVFNTKGVRPFIDAAEDLFDENYRKMIGRISTIIHDKKFDVSKADERDLEFVDYLPVAIAKGTDVPEYMQFCLAVERFIKNYKSEAQPE